MFMLDKILILVIKLLCAEGEILMYSCNAPSIRILMMTVSRKGSM